MKRLRFVALLPLAAALAAGLPNLAPAAEIPPQKIDVSKLTYKEQDVVIPVPSEIFNALDKLGGSPNWAGQVMAESPKRWTTQPEIALMLGTVIANGFIAVQAKDSGKVDEIGRRVIELSNSLGVGKAVISHCNSISDAAKVGDWDAVRSELDKAQSSVREAMDILSSQDESELVSIGGWLRGTQALTSIVRLDYKPERAELLYQPELLDTFDRQLKIMLDNPKMHRSPIVGSLRTELQKIRPLVAAGANATIPQKSVEEINDVTLGLVKSIAP